MIEEMIPLWQGILMMFVGIVIGVVASISASRDK